MPKRTNNKGITLIALIITIIVLLILAGIAIGALTTNNSILKQAGSAKNETAVSEEAEKVNLAIMDAVTNASKTVSGELSTEIVKNAIKGQFGEESENNVIGSGPWKYKGEYNTYKIDGNGEIKKYSEPKETGVYAKLYDEGILILSSTDYTDTSKTLVYDFGLVENKSDNNYWSSSTYNTNVKKAIIYDEITPTSTAYWFYGLPNLQSIEGLTNLDTRLVTNMKCMFCGHSSNTPLYGGSETLINIEGRIKNLDLSGFDTSNVEDMSHMFCEQPDLTSLDLSSFDTSKVKNMAYMFAYCQSLQNINLSSFNTQNVSNFEYMFYSCFSLTSIDISSFTVGDIETNIKMSSMFSIKVRTDGFYPINYRYNGRSIQEVSSLRTIYVSNKWNIPNIENVYSREMFYLCTNLVGGNGTVYDPNNVLATYARIDSESNPGYFTLKNN